MGYKRKFGGDDILQVPKQNTVTTNSPKISDSIKESMANFKNIYTKIIFFIKTNFIFSLLTAVLLIVYIALFFTDVVKEADLVVEIINSKCSEFTGTCPFGKRKEESLECDGDDCNQEKCCVDDNNCSSYTGTCPTDYVITNESSVSCTGDNGSCTRDNCCLKTCAAESSITQSDCTGADTEYRGSEICTGDNGVCLQSDCCKQKVYCSSFSGCTNAAPLIDNNVSTLCPGGLCSMDICCKTPEPVASTLMCDSYTCIEPNIPKDNPETIECGEACSDSICCDSTETDGETDGETLPQTTNVMCDSYTCIEPTIAKANPETIECLESGCSNETCCDEVQGNEP